MAGQGHIAGKFDGGDLVAQRIACNYQPGAITLFMEPQFEMDAGRVVADVLVFVEAGFGVTGLPVRSVDQGGVTEIDEFGGIARAE